MKAKIVDLRYKTKEVMASLDRGEPVEITNRGKLQGIIQPVGLSRKKTSMRVKEHPLFGSQSGKADVDAELDTIRDARYS